MGMPLTYAIGLFFVAFLGEALRGGTYGPGSFGWVVTMGAAMALVSLVILGRDARFLIRSPGRRLYNVDGLGWSWRRTAAILPLLPFLWLILVGCAATLTEVSVHVPKWQVLVWALAVQILIWALAQELLFREAVLKVFGASLPVAFAVTAVASALFYLPQGLPAAMIAAGGAVACMALRVAGMHLVAIAAFHGASVVLFGRVFVADLGGGALWAYALVFALGSALFASGVLLIVRAPRGAGSWRLDRLF